MNVVKVENIGQTSGFDYDFYCGLPAFIEGDNEINVLINNGSELSTIALPFKGKDVTIIEMTNPNFSIFSTGTRGAVYHISSGDNAMLVNVSYEGVEIASGEVETEYRPFIDTFEGLEDASDAFDVDAEVLMMALGF